MDKINIHINSKNRDSNEKISNFTVRIPQNLLRLSQDEYFILNSGCLSLTFLMNVVLLLIPNFSLFINNPFKFDFTSFTFGFPSFNYNYKFLLFHH